MSCRNLWGIPLSIAALVILIVLSIVQAIVQIPGALLGLLIGVIANRAFPCIVEFVYMIPLIGRRHISIGRWYQSFSSGEKWHSRWRDLRVAAEGGVHIHAIPYLSDNYCYLIVGPDLTACLVDPGDAKRVLHAIPKIERAFYERKKITVKAILTTHKHWDHQGGNVQICKSLPSCTHVYCGENATPFDKLHKVNDGDQISVGSLEFKVIAAASHTRGSVMYMHGNQKQCLFTGDTLFSGGCGMTFEGSDIEMLRNFVTMQMRCKPGALLFPGHEYTELLLERCMSEGSWGGVSPGQFFSMSSVAYRAFHRRMTHEKLPTLPVSLEEEIAVNRNFTQVAMAIRKVNYRLKESESSSEPPMGDDPDDTPEHADRTFTTSHINYKPSHVILETQDWLALKLRYPEDESLLRHAEERPYTPVEEKRQPFGTPVSTIEDAFSVCGVESGSKIISKERLLWCVKDNEAAIRKLMKLFDEKTDITPKELVKSLDIADPTNPSIYSQIASCCSAWCRKSDEDSADEEEVENDRDKDEYSLLLEDKEPLQTKDAHAIEDCSYCRLQLLDSSAHPAPSSSNGKPSPDEPPPHLPSTVDSPDAPHAPAASHAGEGPVTAVVNDSAATNARSEPSVAIEATLIAISMDDYNGEGRATTMPIG
eukprot:GEMP01025385.1.p1 GENE.GEMP01025385.1~~GEMP01025385.1.p1  ORF type:complete len:661 (+),score=101.00 GEMP01025385.1:32-1984(+)